MTSRVLVVVQARTGSTRFPGKVLAEIGDRPMLELMLDRLAPLTQSGATVVVATTGLARDDAVAELATRSGTPVVRGDEADVLARFTAALEAFPADDVVRLTADCPLIDPQIVTDVIAAHHDTRADYTSNTLVRTFPDGLDVEVFRADVLRRAANEATDATEREHVTPYVYRRPRTFGIAQVTNPLALGNERWTVDHREDLEIVRAAVASVDDPTRASWSEFLLVLGHRAPVSAHPVVATPGPLVTHTIGHPYERRWALTTGMGMPVGDATVSVDDGIGTLRISLAEEQTHLHDPSAAAVRDWLAADLQVRRLVEPETETR